MEILLRDIKLDLLVVMQINKSEWIVEKLVIQSLNRRLFEQYSIFLSISLGQFMSWMLKMSFYMVS